jgi:hypothetical protein
VMKAGRMGFRELVGILGLVSGMLGWADGDAGLG